MRPLVSIVIPAWNEATTLGPTLQALRNMAERDAAAQYEMIVVDDGSTDDTFRQAASLADHVIKHEYNRGKGISLTSGWKQAQGDIVLFLDADLGVSAAHSSMLLQPLFSDNADMSIASFPAPVRKGGFGMVKRLAEQGIYRLSGYRATAPLSGQRAIRRQVLETIGNLSHGFGVEVGLTIDAARAGYRILEVPVPFHHRETGRDWIGFCHRGKQFISVGRTLLDKWRNTAC